MGTVTVPVTVIRYILELPGEIRSFPGSRCNLPPDLCSPALEGGGQVHNVWVWQSSLEDKLAGSLTRQHH